MSTFEDRLRRELPALADALRAARSDRLRETVDTAPAASGVVAGLHPQPVGACRAVTAGWYHSCAIAADDTIVCWGDNDWGQIDAPVGVHKAVDRESVPEQSDLWGTSNPRPNDAFVSAADPGLGILPGSPDESVNPV